MRPAERIPVTFTLNGRQTSVEVEPRMLLVHHLREDQRLTGTHVGCDTSQCGACAVLVDGRAVRSCTMLAAQADGAEITTVEGVAGPVELHPVQEALRRHHGVQCGFCTPGMVIAALELLAGGEPLDEPRIRRGLAGNVCRCTGYQSIVEAIAEVAGTAGVATVAVPAAMPAAATAATAATAGAAATAAAAGAAGAVTSALPAGEVSA
jgi:carbon-monoxide dehydrogenase small subunit